MFYVNGVFSIMVQSVQLPHYSWTSLNNYIFQSGTTHKMIFQRTKNKTTMKKFKNDWSFIVQGFILLRTNRYYTVLIVTFDERKICFDWIVIDYVKSMNYNFQDISRKLCLNIFFFHHSIRWSVVQFDPHGSFQIFTYVN